MLECQVFQLKMTDHLSASLKMAAERGLGMRLTPISCSLCFVMCESIHMQVDLLIPDPVAVFDRHPNGTMHAALYTFA